MSKRLFSLLFALLLLGGVAAACGDDGGDGGGGGGGGSDSTDQDGGGGGGGGGSDEVQAYCDDVEALAAELDGADITALVGLQDELRALQESGSALSERAQAGDLDQADGEALQACTESLAEAAASIGG